MMDITNACIRLEHSNSMVSLDMVASCIVITKQTRTAAVYPHGTSTTKMAIVVYALSKWILKQFAFETYSVKNNYV